MLAGRPGSNALPAVDERRARFFELRYGFRVPDPSRPLELIRDARGA